MRLSLGVRVFALKGTLSQYKSDWKPGSHAFDSRGDGSALLTSILAKEGACRQPPLGRGLSCELGVQPSLSWCSPTFFSEALGYAPDPTDPSDPASFSLTAPPQPSRGWVGASDELGP